MKAWFVASYVVLSLTMAGCGEGGAENGVGPISGPAPPPLPIATPSPTPTITPMPSPTPTPGALDDGRTIVAIEGDSISVDYVGYYAGYFKAQNPDIEVYNLAVGGSGFASLVTRRDRLIALNPDIATVFIGANDLGSNSTAQEFVNKITAYVAPIRANGTKVLVATNLPIWISSNPTYSNKHNSLIDPVATLLKSEVGKTIDGVIDFESDPVIGQASAPTNPQLFADGVHPTDRGYRGAKGGHDYLYDVYRLAVNPLLNSNRNR